jgi:hypothetical protein
LDHEDMSCGLHFLYEIRFHKECKNGIASRSLNG